MAALHLGQAIGVAGSFLDAPFRVSRVRHRKHPMRVGEDQCNSTIQRDGQPFPRAPVDPARV